MTGFYYHEISISIHAPARGATGGMLPSEAEVRFQSTLPRGERHRIGAGFKKSRDNFNPRSREGSDDFPVKAYKLSEFQSTLPRGERQKVWGAWSDYRNFNPRSREGSDCDMLVLMVAVYISIHAPARGATNHFQTCRRQISISIHAPARGATQTLSLFTHLLHISIHAPARGATSDQPG